MRIIQNNNLIVRYELSKARKKKGEPKWLRL